MADTLPTIVLVHGAWADGSSWVKVIGQLQVVQSTDRQALLSNTVSLARTAGVFGLPVVASTSASRVYSA